MTCEEFAYVQGLERRLDTLQHSLESGEWQPLSKQQQPQQQQQQQQEQQQQGAYDGGWAEECGDGSDGDAPGGGAELAEGRPCASQPPAPVAEVVVLPVRAEAPQPAPAARVPVQAEDELRVACAAFDAGRFEAFARKTDAHMARRRSAGLARASNAGAAAAAAEAAGERTRCAGRSRASSSSGSEAGHGPIDEAAFAAGFESDLEREAAAREAAKSAGQRAAEAAAARRKAALDAEAARRVSSPASRRLFRQHACNAWSSGFALRVRPLHCCERPRPRSPSTARPALLLVPP
jgi:hypothetical protein